VNTPLKRSGMARVLKGSHSFTCTPRVSPLPTSHKNYLLDLRENFTRDASVSVNKGELINFWESSISGSGSMNFFEELFMLVR